MKYLAFDIEAANGYKPYSICSIGIVIADTDFNILKRENIWINPRTKYNLNGTRKNVGIDLHLDKELLDRSPDFSEVYPEIRSLLTDADTLVFGHAVDSDVRMLNATCKKYGLECIEFRFLCSQLLYRLYKGEKDVKALNKIAAELGLEYNEHNSEDDAWMSMMTMKFLCAQGLTPLQLADKYHVRMGSNIGFEIVRTVSLDGQNSKKVEFRRQVARIKDFCGKIEVTGNRLNGNVYAIARSLEMSQSDVLKRVLEQIVSNGGKYTTKLAKCTHYVTSDNATSQDLLREKRVDELQQQGILQKLTIQQLLSEDEQ